MNECTIAVCDAPGTRYLRIAAHAGVGGAEIRSKVFQYCGEHADAQLEGLTRESSAVVATEVADAFA